MSVGAGKDEPNVGHRTDESVVLEQRAVLLERSPQLLRSVGRAESAPRDEVGGGRDHPRRVDLQEREMRDELDEIGRPARVETLGANRDAAGLGSRQPESGHGI